MRLLPQNLLVEELLLFVNKLTGILPCICATISLLMLVDVIVRLREAALAANDKWHTSPLPDYSQEHSIHRGNAVLGREDEDRTLDTDDVNHLVRHYSGLSQNPQAPEEWWGGPVALDHFLQGLAEAVQAFVETSSTHRWRAWAVNTQTSTQRGSHWFTVILGIHAQTECPLTPEHSLPESTAGPHLPTDQPAGANVADQPCSTAPPATEQSAASVSSAEQAAPSSTMSFPNLFPSPNASAQVAINWASANSDYPIVHEWRKSCEAWKELVATGDFQRERKRRKLCKDLGSTFQ